MSYIPPLYKKIFHNTRRFFAKHWLAHMNTVQIAITGSQGKTSTRFVLYHILSKLGNTVVTNINLDTNFNVPITALKVKPATHYAIFECGIDHTGEMDNHLSIIKPHIVIITGISSVHTDLEHLGSLDNLIAEKQKLVEHLSSHDFAILNYDDIHVRKMAKHTKAKIIFYGTNEKECDVYVKEIHLAKNGLSFELYFLKQALFLNSHLIGLHHIYTFMAAFCVYQLVTNGKKPLEFPSLTTDLFPLPGRMSIEKGPLGITILNDSLRANPASTISGLHSFSIIPNPEGRKIVILGEMGELEDPEEEHKKIGSLLGTLSFDYVIGIGSLQKITIKEAIRKGFPESNTYTVDTMKEAVSNLKKILKKGDFVYLKGSLLRHMERILMLLDEQEIHCEAISCPFYHSCAKCKYRYTGYNSTLK